MMQPNLIKGIPCTRICVRPQDAGTGLAGTMSILKGNSWSHFSDVFLLTMAKAMLVLLFAKILVNSVKHIVLWRILYAFLKARTLWHVSNIKLGTPIRGLRLEIWFYFPPVPHCDETLTHFTATHRDFCLFRLDLISTWKWICDEQNMQLAEILCSHEY